MILALLRKELRQHGGVFVVLTLVLLLGLLLVGGNPVLRHISGSGFEGLRIAIISLLPAAAALLGNALVASEFRDKTRLFLEGLPIPRWQWLAAKYVMQIGVLLGIASMQWMGAWWLGRSGEAITPRFVALLVSKTFCWSWFLGSTFFALAFLGRYRIPVACFVGVALMGLSQSDQFDLAGSAPFALVNDQFAFERERWPWPILALTAAWSVGLTGLGFGLGLIRDATVATLLAEKMSSREKVVMTLLAVAGMVAVSTAIERKDSLESVHLPGAFNYERGDLVRLEITSAEPKTALSPDEALKKVGARLADSLAELSERLGGARLPTVYVVHRIRSGAGTNEFERGDLEPSQGTLVRANVLDAVQDPARLEGWILRRALEAKTSGRSEMTHWAWVSDGLKSWWMTRTNLGLAVDTNLVAAARRAAVKVNLSARTYREWRKVRAEAGPEGAEALAGLTFRVLASQRGDTNVIWALARECFGRDIPKDVRGWWRDVVDPPERRLRRATGLGFVQVAELVRKELGL